MWKLVVGVLGVLVLGAGVVFLVWRPDCSADPDRAVSTSATANENENTREYWTEERMRDAEPAPMPEPHPWWQLPCW